mgnify:CR=1 FL=1
MWNYSFILPNFVILTIFLVYYFVRPRLPIKLNKIFLCLLAIDLSVITIDVLASRSLEHAELFSPFVLRALNALFFAAFIARIFLFFAFTKSVFGQRRKTHFLPFAVETVAKVSVEKSATKVLHIKYTPYIPRKRLLKIAITIGRSRSLYNVSEVWNFDFSDEKVQKKIALQKIFGGEYSEEDLVYVSLEKDYSTKIPGFKSGWGLTIDSFCHGSLDGTCEIIKFEDVKQFYEVNSDSSFSTSYELMIETKDGQKHDCKECNSRITSYGDVEFMKDFLKEIAETRKYLEMAGELEEKKFEDLVSLDELKEIFKNVFGYDTESSLFEVYNLMDRQDEDELTEEKKKNILKAICEDKYSEKDLIHISGKLKFGGDWLGFALTKNSICFAGDSEKIIIPYDEIEVFKNNFELNTPFNDESFFDISKKSVYSFKWGKKIIEIIKK